MNPEALRVRDYMITDVFTLPSDTNIMRAIYLLGERDLSGMPVVDADNRLVGILTERDCIRTALQSGYFDEATGSVAEFMTPLPIATVTPDDSLIDVAELFAESPFRRCPVIEHGRLVGLICRRHVMKALTESAWFGAGETTDKTE
jgi:CBS domain-containing protein